MCKQIDILPVNTINKNELCNKSLRCHLKLTQLFKNLEQGLSYNNDNNTDDSSEQSDDDSSEVGSVLLEDFPCQGRNNHKSIFSMFQNKDRFNSRKHRINVDKLTRDAIDITIRDGFSNISLDSNILQLSNISNQQVKYASIDSEQLKQLKKYTRICLSASHNSARNNMVELNASMRSIDYKSNSSYRFNTI